MKLQGNTPVADRLLELAQAALPAIVDDVTAICQIPAPTFQEAERARFVRERMLWSGLTDVTMDDIGNVVGRFRGTGGGPVILLAAHTDTVFPLETDVTVRTDGEILRAPGVGDNSASVAVMLHAARLLSQEKPPLEGDVLFAATVGEEGLGNLRGMRRVMEDYGNEVDYVIALDGSLGSLVRQGVGSRRLRLTVRSDGGHSWGAFGAPSAIHSLGRIIGQISEIRVPSSPKTTFNVGLIRGGTSVNTIAAEAEAVIDLRSLDVEELKKLEERVRRIVADVCRVTQVTADFELLGDRPTGVISEQHPLCQMVRRIHHQMGIQTRCYPSSTDSNVS
ncbi:MAG TPA: M20/M25/M40 family metallo-hydrolase, partial [Symbiobacteriaceae bacterium]|nr:M20/M25/M40 family metallo-hydrolase [Symbiobacteriaceae bacterium]